MTTENVLKRCQEAYKRREITLDALAEKAGLARSTVNSYINSPPQKPKEPIVKLIATALGIDTSQLPDTDETEDATEPITPDYCAACRDEARKHNEALRTDFNARHESMRQYYEEHMKEVIARHTERYNDLKQHSEERISLIKEHNADKIQELNSKLEEQNGTIKNLTADKTSLQRRNKWFVVAIILLLCIDAIMTIIDFTRGDVGWLRYSLFRGNDHGIVDDIMRYLSVWLA